MTTPQDIANEIVERFSKNYGATHDIVVMVADRNGGATFSSTTTPDETLDIITKTASNALLTGGVTALRNFIQKKLNDAIKR